MRRMLAAAFALFRKPSVSLTFPTFKSTVSPKPAAAPVANKQDITCMVNMLDTFYIYIFNKISLVRLITNRPSAKQCNYRLLPSPFYNYSDVPSEFTMFILKPPSVIFLLKLAYLQKNYINYPSFIIILLSSFYIYKFILLHFTKKNYYIPLKKRIIILCFNDFMIINP